MNGVLVSAKGTSLIALVKQDSGNGSVQLADSQLTFNLSNQLRLCVYFVLWNTCDLKFRFMLKKHYLGCSNFPLSCFAVIKVNLIAVHLMALNISVLTSHLRLSRLSIYHAEGPPRSVLIEKMPWNTIRILKHSSSWQCIRGIVPSGDMADTHFALTPATLFEL